MGRGALVPEDAHLLLPGPQISSSKDISVSGPGRPPYSLQRAPPPGLGAPTPGSTGGYLTLILRALNL